MESRIPLDPGMNGLHSPNPTKRYGEMAVCPTLNIQADKNPDTI